MLKRIQVNRDLELTPVAALENTTTVTSSLCGASVNALFVHTDTPRSMMITGDLVAAARATDEFPKGSGTTVPVARSDLIVHPVQIAQAAEAGARAVV